MSNGGNHIMYKILCVDDSSEVQIMVKRTFNGTAKVISAENLENAQEALVMNEIDLILLDLSLPDGDGFQFFDMMNESEELAQIPVIILSSKDHALDKLRGFHSGAEDYIVKPFDPTELKIRAVTRIKRHTQMKLGHGGKVSSW